MAVQGLFFLTEDYGRLEEQGEGRNEGLWSFVWAAVWQKTREERER